MVIAPTTPAIAAMIRRQPAIKASFAAAVTAAAAQSDDLATSTVQQTAAASIAIGASITAIAIIG